MKEYELWPTSSNLNSNLFAFLVTTIALICLLSLKSKPLIRTNEQLAPPSRGEAEIQWTVQQIEESSVNSKRFVEANPNVPINPPDDTDNFSFRDQQAAQPIPESTKTKEMLPRSNGEEFSSKVTPSSKESSPTVKITENSKIKEIRNENQKSEEKKKASQSPKDMRVVSTEMKEKQGVNIEHHQEKGIKRIINLSKKNFDDKSILEKGKIETPQTQEKKAFLIRPRPKLSPDLLQGPIMKTTSNAPRIGAVSVECRLHPQGIYMQEMLRSIEDQWHHQVKSSLKFIQRDKLKTKISYRFLLLADGTIKNLKALHSQDGLLPEELCRQAILSRVPYGNWTDQMIEDFGISDEITIHFNYR